MAWDLFNKVFMTVAMIGNAFLFIALVVSIVYLLWLIFSAIFSTIRGYAVAIRKKRNRVIAEPKLKKYYRAIKRKNIEAAKEELTNYANRCPARNSRCLHEVFCPECPFGGLAVTSCRKGW